MRERLLHPQVAIDEVAGALVDDDLSHVPDGVGHLAESLALGLRMRAPVAAGWASSYWSGASSPEPTVSMVGPKQGQRTRRGSTRPGCRIAGDLPVHHDTARLYEKPNRKTVGTSPPRQARRGRDRSGLPPWIPWIPKALSFVAGTCGDPRRAGAGRTRLVRSARRTPGSRDESCIRFVSPPPDSSLDERLDPSGPWLFLPVRPSIAPFSFQLGRGRMVRDGGAVGLTARARNEPFRRG